MAEVDESNKEELLGYRNSSITKKIFTIPTYQLLNTPRNIFTLSYIPVPDCSQLRPAQI